MKKLFGSDYLIWYFVALDIVLFLGFSYDELHWNLVNPANNPDWAVQQGISIIVGTFISMIIGFILPYVVYFALLSRELASKPINLPYVIFMTVVFIIVKLVILLALVFFNYFVRYL